MEQPVASTSGEQPTRSEAAVGGPGGPGAPAGVDGDVPDPARGWPDPAREPPGEVGAGLWRSEGWMLRASCRSCDPELFFPSGAGVAATEQVDAAKAVCASCPVCSQCRSYSLATNQQYGVWGGLDEEQRRAVRRAARVGRSARLAS